MPSRSDGATARSALLDAPRVGALAALAIGCAAAAPLGTTPFFASHDGLVHLWRVWEYARVLASGALPRVAPDAAYGFGAPIFTFYNPLSYLAAAPIVLAGLGAGNATRLLFALSLVVSALAAYALGAHLNRRAPITAGLCAALLYTFDGYRVSLVYVRGALPEALGLALAPLCVLAALRVAERGTNVRASALWLAVATGCLILTHTIAALLTLPLALGLALARCREVDGPLRPRLAALAGGLVLGVALGAVYWLPGFAQQADVHLERARWTGDAGGVTNGFAWPWQLVQWSALHDYARDFGEAVPTAERRPSLGAPTAAALLLGAVAGWRSRLLRRPIGLVAIAAVALALFLASPPALPLWRVVPLLPAVQLGWRFLAVILVAALPLAAGLADLPLRPGALVAVVVAALAGLAAFAPLPLQPLHWSRALERPTELAAFERKSGEFALGALREYVPQSVRAEPEDLPLAPADPPAPSAPSVRARLLDTGPMARRYRVTAPQPTTLTFDLFAQPALVARVDGAVVPLSAAGDEALATLDLAAGDHEVAIGFEPTGIERVGNAITATAAVLLSGLALGRGWKPAAVAVSAVLPITLVLAPSAGIATAAVVQPSDPVALGENARLLGFSADTSQLARTGILTLDLDTQALRAVPGNEPIDVALVDSSGQRVAESIGGPSGGFRPTGRWRANELLRLRHELLLPADLPAGHYAVAVELAGASTSVGAVDLPAARSADPAALVEPFTRFESIYGDELVLDGYVYDKDGAARPLRGAFWWRRVRTGAPLYDATLRLVDKQGGVVAEETRRVGGTANLRPEADFALLPVEPVRPESYRLELLVRPVGGAPLPVRPFAGSPSDALRLAWLDVRDPCACVPADATPLNAAFADGIALAGYTADQRGADVDLSLYWRADARPSRDYVVFVHLLGGDRTVAQADDMPNGGRRPTAGWQPGDVVPDRYRLRPSTGRATAVEVGLYRPDNNQRLPLIPATPSNAIRLPLPAGAP